MIKIQTFQSLAQLATFILIPPSRRFVLISCLTLSLSPHALQNCRVRQQGWFGSTKQGGISRGRSRTMLNQLLPAHTTQPSRYNLPLLLSQMQQHVERGTPKQQLGIPSMRLRFQHCKRHVQNTLGRAGPEPLNASGASVCLRSRRTLWMVRSTPACSRLPRESIAASSDAR